MPVDDGQSKGLGSGDEVIVLGLGDTAAILSEVEELLSVGSGDEPIFLGRVGVGGFGGGVLPDVLGTDLEGVVH